MKFLQLWRNQGCVIIFSPFIVETSQSDRWIFLLRTPEKKSLKNNNEKSHYYFSVVPEQTFRIENYPNLALWQKMSCIFQLKLKTTEDSLCLLCWKKVEIYENWSRNNPVSQYYVETYGKCDCHDAFDEIFNNKIDFGPLVEAVLTSKFVSNLLIHFHSDDRS